MIKYLNLFVSAGLFSGFLYVFGNLVKVMEGLVDVCVVDSGVSVKRGRLIAYVNGGAKQYLGKHYTEEQIGALSADDVERLNSQYESRLGAAMVKSLGKTIISLYSSVVSNALGLGDSELEDDWGSDRFWNAALPRVKCHFYYRFGSYFAPLCVVITGKHYLKKSWSDKN